MPFFASTFSKNILQQTWNTKQCCLVKKSRNRKESHFRIKWILQLSLKVIQMGYAIDQSIHSSNSQVDTPVNCLHHGLKNATIGNTNQDDILFLIITYKTLWDSWTELNFPELVKEGNKSTKYNTHTPIISPERNLAPRKICIT